MKRKNKNKKEIVSDIQLIQDAERRRSLIRDIIFPYLTSLDENVAYVKVFLQAFNGLINGVYDEQRKTTTVGHLTPRIDEKLSDIFKGQGEEIKKEGERYSKLVELLKDISVDDLTYATELPRFIDGFLLKKTEKDSIKSIPIDEILGK